MKADRQPIPKPRLTDYYKNNGLFFKADIIVLLIIVILVVVSVAMVTNKAQGEYIEIYYKGELISRHSLNEDKTISIDEHGHNVIVISGGQVYMAEANCENQICVKSAKISLDSQRIICAPNGIVVIVRGKELDGISGGQI